MRARILTDCNVRHGQRRALPFSAYASDPLLQIIVVIPAALALGQLIVALGPRY